jgi:hypothetical protein
MRAKVDTSILYLARVLVNGQQFVHKINPHEYTLPMNGVSQHCTAVKRVKSSWEIVCFGIHGAAAISDSPHGAIGSAKVRLEQMAMHLQNIKTKAGVERVSSYA